MAPKICLCVAFVIASATAAFAQEDPWKKLIDSGASAEAAGDYVTAAGFYQEAARINDSVAGGDYRRAYALNAFGLMQDTMGRFTDAESAFRTALRLVGDGAGVGASENRAMILVNLAAVSSETGQYARAEKLLREAKALHAAAAEPDPKRLAVAENALGELLILTGRTAEAESLVTSALAALEKTAPASTETAIARNNVAVVRTFQNRLVEAQDLLDRSLAALERGSGPNHPVLIRVLNNRAVVEHRRGEARRAGETWRRALDLAARTLGTEHPTYADVLTQYAHHLRDTGDKKMAKMLAARATEIRRGSRRRNGIGAVVDVAAFGPKAQ